MSVDSMKTQLIAIFALAILLIGCTSNPQDLAAKQPARNSTLQANSYAQDNNLSVVQNQTPPASISIILTAAEVAKHSAKGDCWLIINGVVYDLSNFTTHPGGDAYVPYCGTDATEAYATKGGKGQPHSTRADSMLPNFEVGPLGQTVSR